ncbi:D-alanyl-D-alanine carboxypeptidase family protein [Neomegalonema perideroedes]|uniref:D-alanyl-D-alanine carboxypeptidase family protein n=1 Tax=Neomegalonema perideroedes TaxID=217219 RepID=UPI00036F47A3|nr:D-alanyl-D-alanine carboxypeptidase family protein [Neomegalonema perideroedes]
MRRSLPPTRALRVLRALTKGALAAGLAALVLTATAPQAAANPKYASVTMDVRTGEILASENPDKRLYPASLTKMMTLYLVFEAIENKQLRIDQSFVVSARAAAQPATKLGLKRGETITLRQAIHAAAVRSANDAVVVLAEAVAGDEETFAQRMTAKAKALGMTNSAFRNPHGLTAAGQLSSARDMAILGRRIYLDFPQYYPIFSREAVVWGGRRMPATNKLLTGYPGTDGLKTGYTVASGYNLVSTAERDGRRVLVAVFGGTSARSRDQRVMTLMDQGFALLKSRAAAPAVAAAPAPQPRPTGLVMAPPPRPKPTIAQRPTAVRMAAFQPPAGAPAARIAAQNEEWAVQLGGFPTGDEAQNRIHLAAVMGVLRPETQAAPRIVADARPEGGFLYRAQILSLRMASAHELCHAFMTQGMECAITPPAGWRLPAR